MNIATCIEGLEDICAKEVKGRKILPGRIEFKGKVLDFKSVINVYSLIKKFKFKSKDDIVNKIKKRVEYIKISLQRNRCLPRILRSTKRESLPLP